MTLKYLHCLLQDGTQFIEMKKTETLTLQDSEPALLKQVEKCLMFVTKSVDELRHFLSNLPDDDGIDVIDETDSCDVFNIGEESWGVMGKWIAMDSKVGNMIGRQTGRWSGEPVFVTPLFIISCCFFYFEDCISNQRVFRGGQIMQNVSFTRSFTFL